MEPKHGRRYYGIGAALIAFGIKFSINHGCRGDVVFEAKTDELAKHYAEDFHARYILTKCVLRWAEEVYVGGRGCVAAVFEIS